MDLSTTRVLIKSAYYKKFKQYREVPRRKQKKKNHFKMPHSKSAIINIRWTSFQTSPNAWENVVIKFFYNMMH